MATLHFFLRESTRGKSYLGSLCARIIHSRKIKVLTCPVKLYPGEWDSYAQRIILPDEDTDRYLYLRQATDTLYGYNNQFEEVVERLERTGRYSLEDIVEGYRLRRSMINLYGFTEQHPAICPARDRNVPHVPTAPYAGV